MSVVIINYELFLSYRFILAYLLFLSAIVII